jgi:hypothetical protein
MSSDYNDALELIKKHQQLMNNKNTSMTAMDRARELKDRLRVRASEYNPAPKIGSDEWWEKAKEEANDGEKVDLKPKQRQPKHDLVTRLEIVMAGAPVRRVELLDTYPTKLVLFTKSDGRLVAVYDMFAIPGNEPSRLTKLIKSRSVTLSSFAVESPLALGFNFNGVERVFHKKRSADGAVIEATTTLTLAVSNLTKTVLDTVLIEFKCVRKPTNDQVSNMGITVAMFTGRAQFEEWMRGIGFSPNEKPGAPKLGQIPVPPPATASDIVLEMEEV